RNCFPCDLTAHCFSYCACHLVWLRPSSVHNIFTMAFIEPHQRTRMPIERQTEFSPAALGFASVGQSGLNSQLEACHSVSVSIGAPSNIRRSSPSMRSIGVAD